MAAAAAMFGPRPEMVVVETDPPLLCFLGAVLRLRFRCRLVIYLQDLYPDLAVALGKVRPSWSIRLLRRLIFAVYRRADRIVVLSRDMQKVLVESGVCAERIAVHSQLGRHQRGSADQAGQCASQRVESGKSVRGDVLGQHGAVPRPGRCHPGRRTAARPCRPRDPVSAGRRRFQPAANPGSGRASCNCRTFAFCRTRASATWAAA